MITDMHFLPVCLGHYDQKSIHLKQFDFHLLSHAGLHSHLSNARPQNLHRGSGRQLVETKVIIVDVRLLCLAWALRSGSISWLALDRAHRQGRFSLALVGPDSLGYRECLQHWFGQVREALLIGPFYDPGLDHGHGARTFLAAAVLEIVVAQKDQLDNNSVECNESLAGARVEFVEGTYSHAEDLLRVRLGQLLRIVVRVVLTRRGMLVI